MAKKQPQPASYWLSKLGDNERKYVEENRYMEINSAISMTDFLFRSFRPHQKREDPVVIDLIERSIPR